MPSIFAPSQKMTHPARLDPLQLVGGEWEGLVAAVDHNDTVAINDIHPREASLHRGGRC
jgi:hypothetical protein